MPPYCSSVLKPQHAELFWKASAHTATQKSGGISRLALLLIPQVGELSLSFLQLLHEPQTA